MNSKVIFEAIAGSRSYGTDTPESDYDYKSLYVQHPNEILGFGYKEQTNFTKDNVGYEIRRFLELLCTGNPNINELLWMPEDCVLERKPVFDILVENRHMFLTKKCYEAYSNYAIQQIVKSASLNKKANLEKNEVQKKDVLDFTYAIIGSKTIPVKTYLAKKGMLQENCGLVRLDHAKGLYALYHDDHFYRPDHNLLGYKGIAGPDSNEVRISSVPKGQVMKCVVSFNLEGYSHYCKTYNEYQHWLQNRNEARYIEDKAHGQFINGKNMLHCRRLLDMSFEIATEKKIIVRRPNSDYLLKIKRGEVSLKEITEKAQEDIERLKSVYDDSTLPDDVNMDKVNDILLQIRKETWK